MKYRLTDEGQDVVVGFICLFIHAIIAVIILGAAFPKNDWIHILYGAFIGILVYGNGPLRAALYPIYFLFWVFDEYFEKVE